MLILEIALGIILACVAMVAAPILFGVTMGAVAHLIIALTKPHKLALADSGKLRLSLPSSTVLWTVGICLAIFAVVCIKAYKAAP
jgi:hypothetical protein